ncbi:MAG TPA: MetQ/NlpA family ABC transporter substrate-binding protein [Candidatus Enterocloster excrementigallinarum]|uniref:MetQ/NlpA family ABC transporter substrate-binding protein n=1 Tax=Candidatus Enterocloster excrementigallinarum TaxID=2838558 RepID=A0A9D2PQ84_9FIRM|nr:MetQ/NlpA family ABC transporter substrate-binding protein [Candidatus Enterocloster excrementigallinarum]
MKKKNLGTIALAAALACAALAGCSGNSQEQTTAASTEGTEAAGEETEAAGAESEVSEAESAASGELETLVVGATASPHAEILEVVKPILAEQGYDLQIQEFTDYVLPNRALEEGELDANYFQHIQYLESYNEQNGTDLVSAGEIHYEPFGIYAGKTTDLSQLPDGATVFVPNDITNEARALLLLQDQGLLTLKEGAGLEATPNDIEENPKNLEIVEMEAAMIPRTMDDCDIAIINGNYALEAGLNVSEALAAETSDSLAAQTYANVVAVRSGDENSEKIQALVQALCSDEVKEFIDATYNGAVVALF